ncbi:MAG: hypothetical protein MJ180_02315 [Candidatus Gastranaerophilales bacterium]|nr:hypothetical protein [Candidatus Gastranaerophilales bacterium]
MQILKIQNSQNFGYRLTPAFEDRFAPYTKLISELKQENNDRLTLDYTNQYVELSIVADDDDQPLKASNINNLSVKSIKKLEEDMIYDYLCKSIKKGKLPETADILLKNFPHLTEIISSMRNNKNFLRMSNHNKEKLEK